MRQLKRVLPHLLFILSGIFIAFLILDEYNPTMNFINNNISIKLLWSFCLLSLLNSVVMMIDSRKDISENNKASDLKDNTDNKFSDNRNS